MSVETKIRDYRLVREGRRIAVYNKHGDLISLAMNWREAEEFVNDLPVDPICGLCGQPQSKCFLACTQTYSD
jgi:hypothetical protein